MPRITSDVEEAADAIRRGGLVALPTETVYGLAADATNVAAVRRVFEVKGRPPGHPLIVHLADGDQVDRWGRDLGPVAHRLAATAWPGPLTLIVPRHPRVVAEATGGRDTVGLRVPAHPVARALISAAGTALAAPSANRFGSVSPTTAAHVAEDLDGRLDADLDLILDGGPCSIGVESTIVDTTVDPPQLLRAGGLGVEALRTLLADVEGVTGELAGASGPARASGMLASHYAPTCDIRLVERSDEAIAVHAGLPGSRILDLTEDVGRYARDLFAELRRADRDGVEVLIAVLPPADGLGAAVRDRLTKAAAPRPGG